ncbi:beta galactosidase jelly roll domain-containing protein [Phenylobacterium montanum]|uniref:Beta galactosidase jelly roll domain-containing protein n=1 Tax=Phenylobacterium montanum TaxID=2823693 RepID=A0A975G522_9CAUL|nr:beta galactosidase jelly roll domain-containing protein [Caulobacter sp. S6]
MKPALIGLAVFFASAGAAAAQTAAPPPLLAQAFTDHAVLQRGAPIPVWGWAKAGETVSLDFDGQTVQARADASGRWSARLAAHSAGGPFELTARGEAGETQTLHDLLVGDVWLCSGQSNMEFTLRHATNADVEVGASANDQIRLIHIPKVSAATPQSGFGAPTAWRPAGPASAADFSAACFLMGKELQADQHIPIGLIDASWGGSDVRAWMSPEALHRFGGYDDDLAIVRRHAADPVGAATAWSLVMERWYKAHDPGFHWNDPALDDSAWATTPAAGYWEGWGVPALARFDGIVWYRTTVTLTAEQAKGEATIALGPADDMDTSFVNGVFVGGIDSWNAPRTYRVPAGVLHAGVNSIAVRVLDTGGGGGLWGQPKDRFLRLADGSSVPINGTWRWRIAAPLTQTGPAPHAPWQDAVGMVTLYNGLIAPLDGYGLKGFAWYQGEQNISNALEYRRLLPAMIADWRGRFGADLPFLIVQLANFGPAVSQPGESDWAAVREAQRLTVEHDLRTGLAVAVDVGQRYDIHPTDKQDVGHRLALLARHIAYGEAVTASGPRPLGASQAGDRITIRFADVAAGLVVYGAARPIGFEACDGAGHCRFVDATVGKDQVVLDAAGLGPVAKVRYAWADSPVVNLYNSEDLPATPFEIEVR